jgi:hypothetical protein
MQYDHGKNAFSAEVLGFVGKGSAGKFRFDDTYAIETRNVLFPSVYTVEIPLYRSCFVYF